MTFYIFDFVNFDISYLIIMTKYVNVSTFMSQL